MAVAKYKDWLTKEGLLKVSAWARNGLSDEQIAGNMRISVSTYYEWKQRYSEFAEAIKNSKEIADIHVENALYKRALGYTAMERRIEKEYGEISKETEVIKPVPPDVAAIIFWLKNRKPDTWRDKPTIETTNRENVLAEKLAEVFKNVE